LLKDILVKIKKLKPDLLKTIINTGQIINFEITAVKLNKIIPEIKIKNDWFIGF